MLTDETIHKEMRVGPGIILYWDETAHAITASRKESPSTPLRWREHDNKCRAAFIRSPEEFAEFIVVVAQMCAATYLDRSKDFGQPAFELL